MCKDSTLGRICKSAPTVFLNSMARAVEFVQAQRIRGSLCDYVAQAVGFVQMQRVRVGYRKLYGAWRLGL